MEITLNITEDSKVELVKDSCEAVQGERNVTILKLNFPSKIRGYSIDNYAKQIEFAECKELGECVKFFDVVEGDTYKLCDICTQFEKIMIQFKLTNLVDEAEPIIWKSVPFALEFCESINAENTKQAQVALLSLAEIEKEWENFIKDNTFRVISKVGDVPTADAASLGDTIFYLGANSTSPYTLTYGHYYRCNFANDKYEWTDLTQDPSLEGVANGIREINNNQSMQLWVGTQEELKNEVIQDNVIYIPEDHDITETFDEILTEMAEKNSGVLKFDDKIVPSKKLIATKEDLGNAATSFNITSYLTSNGVDTTKKFKLQIDLYSSAPLNYYYVPPIYGIHSSTFVIGASITSQSGTLENLLQIDTVTITNNGGIVTITSSSVLGDNTTKSHYISIENIYLIKE